MTAWQDRSEIPAAYLNPGLLAMLVSSCARGYMQEAERAMSWPLAFLALPLVLHRPTRQALPGNTRTHLSTWLARNPLIRAEFPERARSLAPFVREGLRFGVRERVLILEDRGLRGEEIPLGRSGDIQPLIRSANLVGRWLAKTGQSSTTFALLGVTP